MNKEKHTENMLEKIDSDFAEMRKALEEGNFSDEAIQRIQDTTEMVELQAYKTKFTLKLRSLAEETPELKTKTVLDKMFALLPVDITPTFLPILAAHVVERWKELTFKSAAA